MPSKAFRHQGVAIKVGLVVAIGMDSRYLSKHVFANNRRVWRISYATVTSDNVAYLHKRGLINMFLHVHLVFQHDVNAAQWRIATTLTKTVHGDVQTCTSSLNRHERVTNCHVIIIVAMELKLHARVSSRDRLYILIGIYRIKYSKRVWQQKSDDSFVIQRIHHLPNIIATVSHALRPILKVEVDRHSLRMCVSNYRLDVAHMFFKRLLQLVLAML